MWGVQGWFAAGSTQLNTISLSARPSASRCGQRCHWMGGSLNEKTLWQKKKTMRFEEDFGKFPSVFFFWSDFFFGWVGGWEDFRGNLLHDLVVILLVSSVKKPTWATHLWPKGFGNSDRPFGRFGCEPSGREPSCRNRKMPLALKKPTESSAQCWMKLRENGALSPCWLTYWTCVVYVIKECFFFKGKWIPKKMAWRFWKW